MPEVCPVMDPGEHCICHDNGGDCCYCVVGAENCADDESGQEE